MTLLESFTIETFSGRVSEAFRITNNEGAAIDVRLDQVTPLGAGTGKRTPFSLLYRGPAQPILAQQIYRFTHVGLGEFDLFIVPVGHDADSTLYEAVFT